jgi:hypothetical protein
MWSNTRRGTDGAAAVSLERAVLFDRVRLI